MRLTESQQRKVAALQSYVAESAPSELFKSATALRTPVAVNDLAEAVSQLVEQRGTKYSQQDLEQVEVKVKENGAELGRLFFWMGPQYDDLRQKRPYFLVPIGDAALPGETDVMCDQIAAFAEQAKPFTDLYVLSHGWHRNLFSGVAAYDRLMSRFSVLRQRGRLNETPSADPGPDFKPFFIAFHWHSDPGDDRWTDKSGRRHKESFLENYEEVFEPGQGLDDGDFLKNAEDQFELMTQLSSPDLNTLDQGFDRDSLRLTDALDKVNIRFCSSKTGASTPPSIAEKVSMLWRCYFEAASKAILEDQPEHPKPVGSPANALSSLAKFVIGAVGLVALIGFINLKPVGKWITHGWRWLTDQLPNGWGGQPWGQAATGAALYLVGAIAFALLFLGYTRMARASVKAKCSKLHGLSPLVAVLWIVPQVLWTLPILIGLFTSFIFRTNLALLSVTPWIVTGNGWWSLAALTPFALYAMVMSIAKKPVPGLFDERAHKRRAIDSWRDGLAGMARLPIRWLRDIMAADSKLMVLGEALDSQFAFFEMQQKGARVGAEAGEVIARIVPHLGEDVKIHFVGHSFGGLVVCNAAKTYLDAGKDRRVQSMCLVQAAIASNWFRGEDSMLQATRGPVACIYSAYDTANGFYYPMANNGRLAAGYVGLCQVGSRSDAAPIGQKARFSMLVQPPDLGGLGAPSVPCTLNLDASRLIYEGAVATGGGHDDIFKDDVVNLIWAASRWGLQVKPAVSKKIRTQP